MHINNNRIRANGGGVSVDQGGGSGSTKVYLENNLIDSNITSSTPSAIYIGQGFHMYIIGDTITNNVSSGSYLIYLKYGWNPYVNSIKNNYIANNKSTSSDLMFYYYSVSYANTTFDFTDNTIKDNTASNGAIFTMYGNNGYLGFNFNISGNNIVNNTANATFNLIKFSGSINNNSIYNTVAYEIRNQNLAAEPTINAKNNFWSRTRAALDGYVYDYFDDGNLSLVLFDPVITSLPLTLLNFDGTKNGNLLHLKWQTFNEINSSLFNVQRSADGANFHNVGKVKAVGSSENNYVFTDSASLNSLVIYYRLQSVDKDGFKVFSQIIKLELTDKHALSIYPNPVKSFFTIKGSHINQVRITNSEGKLLGVYEFNDGTNPVINAAMLASGSYIVTINADGNKMSTTLKFLKN